MYAIKKFYSSSFIFVYTASEKTWANKEIAIIEKQNNIKFNRPIFTRDNCIIDKNGMIKKSVNKIIPHLLKTMKVKKDYDISKKLLIIDNNPTFVDLKIIFYFVQHIIIFNSVIYGKIYLIKNILNVKN